MTTSPLAHTTPTGAVDASVFGDLTSAYPVSSKPRRRWLVVVVLVLALTGLAVGAWSFTGWTRNRRSLAALDRGTVALRTFDVVLKEKGELKAARSTDIMCEVEGQSTIISLIPEGTVVQKGDLLVELASDEIEDRIRKEELKEANAITAVDVARTELDVQRDKNESDVRKADLAIEMAALELEKYQKGEWVQRLKDAQIAIDQATIMLGRREEDFEAAKRLYEKKFITKTEYQEDEFNHQRAIWDLDKAKNAKEVLELYTHVADLRQKQANHDEAVKEHDRAVKNAAAQDLQKTRSLEGKEKELALIQDQLAKFRRQREKCRITAPTQGFVVYYSNGGYWSNNDQIREGGTVRERQILLSLPDTAEMQVVVRVHEAKTDKLALGQRVRVTVEGLPGDVFGGTVTKIAALADTQNRWLNPDLKEYETEVTLDPSDVALKPGVTAYAEIMVDTVQNQLAVPVQSVYARGERRYVFRAGATGPRFAEITLGAIGNEWAEIRDGLKAGDEILLAYTDEQKRLIPELHDEASDAGRRKGGARAGENGRTPEKSAEADIAHETAAAKSDVTHGTTLSTKGRG